MSEETKVKQLRSYLEEQIEFCFHEARQKSDEQNQALWRARGTAYHNTLTKVEELKLK